MTAYYKAGGGQDKVNRNVFVGGTGGWAGRLVIQPSGGYNAIANANSAGYLNQALVQAGHFNNNNQIATVSGLTYCVGVLVARRVGNQRRLGDVVVAHFNGGWDHGPSWSRIAQRLQGGVGALYGIVVATSDSTAGETVDRILNTFSSRMTANTLDVQRGELDIAESRLLLYRSSTSGVEFGITRQGVIGEPTPTLHTR